MRVCSSLSRLAVLIACIAVASSAAGEPSSAASPVSARLEPALHVSARLEPALQRASALPRLHALVIAHRGRIVSERRYRGPGLDVPVNVKSVSKSIVATLIGIAIGEGKLRVDQTLDQFFPAYRSQGAGPRLHEITIDHLLSMRSGLARTSGEGYGPWVRSRNWVAHILRQPLIAEPGSSMIYSTGNTHLLSAILTRATGTSTFVYARERLARPLGIALRPWERDPQGIYVGGNQMFLSPHDLVRIGELYRNRGRHQGRQVVPEAWIDAALTPRARSIFSGQMYGYGWFLAELGGHPAFFAWGYGGQFIFVVPALELTVVTTSDVRGPRDFEHLGAILELVRERVVPALESDGTALDTSGS